MLAVVISGSLRTFEEIWSGNQHLINSLGIPYKVFFHTWDKDYKTVRKVYKDNKLGGFAFGIKPKEYSGSSRSVDLEDICRIIPSAKISIETFQEQQIAEFLKIPAKNENVLFQNMVNSVAMYMGISRAFQLALSDEDTSKFTHFLRIRTDFQICQSISRQKLDADIYFCRPIVDTGYGAVSDQCFFVKADIAILMANLESKVSEHVVLNGWGVHSGLPFYGERILAYFLQNLRDSSSFEYSPTIGQIKRPPTQPVQGQNWPNWIYELLRFNLSVVERRFKFVAGKLFRYFKHF